MDSSIVLLSGGWESVACLIMAKQDWGNPTAMFVDYGQPYLKQEQRAVAAIADAMEVVLIVEKIPAISQTDGIFDNRNGMFLELAMRYHPREIYFGARAPLDIFDPYRDSNWQFAKRMEKAYGVSIRTPLIMWPKFMVKSFVKHYGFNPDFIYSSEGYKYEHSK